MKPSSIKVSFGFQVFSLLSPELRSHFYLELAFLVARVKKWSLWSAAHLSGMVT